MKLSIPNERWDKWVKRVVIHVPHYLSPDGDVTAGGRQRNVRDIAKIIRDSWGREPIIIQKARKNFETPDANGVRVVGIKTRLDKFGDPTFGKKTSQFICNGDAILYMGQDDAWPFFVRNAKAFHVGVWWDGPFGWTTRAFVEHRTLSMVTAVKSMLCVDTNIINWIRCRGKRGLDLASKCEYIPNCVDLSALRTPNKRGAPNTPLKILFARRYERKRGGELFLGALAILRDKGLYFDATLSSALGQSNAERVHEHVRALSLENYVRVVTNDMDSVMKEYENVDVAVIPTVWSEGTSYSCIEAIAAGIPVVTTPVGGLGNLVIPGYNGYLVPPLSTAIADAIIQTSEPNQWQALHEACLAMRSSLSIELWNERVLDWLKS